MALRVGVPRYNPTLVVLAEREPGVARWTSMHGVDAVAAFAAGTLDATGTGVTPLLDALAAGADVRLVAASAPRPGSAALLVPAGSPIASVAELPGATVGLPVGAYHGALLAAALEREGLRYADVEVVHASGRSGHEAYAAGKLDAWIASDAYLLETERTVPSRRLAETGDLLSNRVLWWASRAAAVDAFLARVEATERWIAEHPRAAAELLGSVLGEQEGAHLLAAWERSLRGRAWGLHDVTAAVLDELQATADLLHRHGLHPTRVVVERPALAGN